MVSVPIGVSGEIIEGDHVGWYVKVIDDCQNTGGYLILFSKSKDGNYGIDEAYDNWVENLDQVMLFFNDEEEADWVILWDDV